MARVLTNNVALAYSIESALGTAGSTWKQLEPNSIDAYGAEITTVARSPISKLKQRRKGTIVDLDSAVEFETDLTMASALDFIEGFCFAQSAGGTEFAPSACDTDSFTVASGGALDAGTLVYVRGAANSENNGVHVVDTGSSGTDIPVTSSLVAETFTASDNVTLEVAGVRGAAGDLEIDANGDLISTVLDFTGLDLTVGQFIWIGGAAAANQFFEQANSSVNFGLARVDAIAANKLTLSKRGSTFTADDGTDTGSGGTDRSIDIFFGRFIRNVATDDADYLERSFHFEAEMPDLGGVGTDEYEYAKGNFCNTMAISLPGQDKATVAFGFIGTDTEVPTTTRKSGASSAQKVTRQSALNTASDIARLRITEVDETGLTTDFKDLTFNINNNVSPEKVLAVLGARYMNSGNFEIDIEAQLVFTNSDVVTAIRNNTTVTMDMLLRNDDGGMAIDIPSMTLGDGSKEYPLNESVLINVTAQAFKDNTLETSIGITMFPYLPSV
jgi:hypothetical protein